MSRAYPLNRQRFCRASVKRFDVLNRKNVVGRGENIGYIARNTLPQYQNFNPTNAVCPFAGRVKVTRQGYLWAEILVALPMDRDFVKEELTSYLEAIPYES